MGSPKFIWRSALLGVGALLCVSSLAHHTSLRILAVEMSLPVILLVAGNGAITDLEERRPASSQMAPLIAIVGCDGSGKSTLAGDMSALLNERRPTQVCYLGLGSGEIGNRIKRWPLIGPALEHHLARKAAQTRTRDARIPGLLTAMVVFGFSILRLRRFRHVLALRRHGITVITDRYPQIEVPGFYDGPGLSAARAGSRPVAWLAERERRMYIWMASFRPDIIIRLNVDAATAFARKPDHKFELLRAKVEVTPLLRFNGARIIELDARERYEDVREKSLESVRALVARPLGQARP
jgi:thymidylate kinase